MVAVGNRTACESGARERRPSIRDGTEGGWVSLDVEKRRLGTRREIAEWREAVVVVAAAAMAMARTRV